MVKDLIIAHIDYAIVLLKRKTCHQSLPLQITIRVLVLKCKFWFIHSVVIEDLLYV